MRTHPEPSRLSTGISGLDDVLLGGLPKGKMYLLEGHPGAGKTTMALQFTLQGKQQGERCLYVSLSESRTELESTAHSHNWSLDDVPIVEFVPEEASIDPDQQYTVFHPSEVELATNIKRLLAEVERVDPERLVLDSLSEFRLLAQDPVRYRRQLLALKQFFGGRHTTVLLLDDQANHGDLQVQSVVHGVVRLETLRRSYGITRRRLEVVKIRGAGYREGFHDYTVDQKGVCVYPRLVASEHGNDFPEAELSAGLPALDAMFGGGIQRGSSTLILGPTGVGKSSIATLYALAAAARGERAVLYSFDETVRTVKVRARSLGMSIDAEIQKQHLCLEQVDPAELSPGEFVSRIKREVEERNARVIVIDSLNGFRHSMPGEVDLALVLHELLTFLDQKGVSTLLVLTQHGLVGEVYADIEVSYLADSVLQMRYFEVAAAVRHAISIVKKRGGAHENTIRELTFDSDGLHIGEPLAGFKGVLSGLPDSIQSQELPSEGTGHGSQS